MLNFIPDRVKSSIPLIVKDSAKIFIYHLNQFIHFFKEQPVKSELFQLKGGGVILSFDDHHISDWFEANSLFEKYNWKATFYVSNFNALDRTKIEKLKILQDQGHEIGAHGANHISAVEFTKYSTINNYIEEEIVPLTEKMKKHGFKVSTFAYPYGERDDKIDITLLKYFNILRGTTYGQKPPSIRENYANGTKVVFGLGIDDHYGYHINYYLKLLRYAKRKNKIVIFYGHKIKKNDPSGFITTSYETLDAICNYVVQHKMSFLLMNDLNISQNQY